MSLLYLIAAPARLPPALYTSHLHPGSVAARTGDDCPGFAKCPTSADFPQPYNGTYPQVYWG